MEQNQEVISGSEKAARIRKNVKIIASQEIRDGAAANALPPKTHNVGGVAGDQLRSIVERIERLEEEKAALNADIREVFAEAKGNGFDVKTLRKIIALRKIELADRQEAEMLLDTYMLALGMQPDLFDAQSEAN